jgi:hypothetical protein
MTAIIEIGYHERMEKIELASDKVFYVLDKKEIEVTSIEEAKKEASKYGSIHYISKPYRDRIILEVIKKEVKL